ncbi:MAG: C40 family peptidase [Armatimonadetes bacterium]|nr:C40 family peptidase [Armatimonadota bacterium]
MYRKNKAYYNLASRGGQIISTAWRFLGVPYRWAGTTSRGFDCSGFVMRVFKLNGINLRRLADQQYYNGNPVNPQNLIPGDLVFFSTYSSGVTHVGIYIGGNQFIHASSSRGVTISNLNDSYYRNRFIGARRYH